MPDALFVQRGLAELAYDPLEGDRTASSPLQSWHERGVRRSQWLDRLLPAFEGRVLAVDLDVARRVARMQVVSPHDPMRSSDDNDRSDRMVPSVPVVTRKVGDSAPSKPGRKSPVSVANSSRSDGPSASTPTALCSPRTPPCGFEPGTRWHARWSSPGLWSTTSATLPTGPAANWCLSRAGSTEAGQPASGYGSSARGRISALTTAPICTPSEMASTVAMTSPEQRLGVRLPSRVGQFTDRNQTQRTRYQQPEGRPEGDGGRPARPVDLEQPERGQHHRGGDPAGHRPGGNGLRGGDHAERHQQHQRPAHPSATRTRRRTGRRRYPAPPPPAPWPSRAQRSPIPAMSPARPPRPRRRRYRPPGSPT